MTSPPECRKCGNTHWRFKPCEVAKAEGARPKQAPHRTFVEREGERPWGDKLNTLKKTGTNTFFQVTSRPAHGGTVTYPPGFQPPTKES